MLAAACLLAVCAVPANASDDAVSTRNQRTTLRLAVLFDRSRDQTERNYEQLQIWLGERGWAVEVAYFHKVRQLQEVVDGLKKGTLDVAGSASIELPDAAGTIADPPLIACYVSLDGLVWHVVGAGPSFAIIQCLLEAGAAGNVRVLIRSSQPGTYGGKDYQIVVVY